MDKNKTSMDKNIFSCFYLLMFYFYLLIFLFFVQLVGFCLEDSTERSESNPGRSLGITNMKYAAVWKTVPTLK